MICPKCEQPTMWNPYLNDVELYICYNVKCNNFTRIKPKEDENMKKRLSVNQSVFIVLPDGVLKGVIRASLKRGMYKVQTFLGNVTVKDGKIYPESDFGRACNHYKSMYGV